MSITDLLGLLPKYGASVVIIVTLALVVVVLWRAQTQDCQEAKDRAKLLQEQNDRLGAEIRSLNLEVQRCLSVGLMVRQAMQDAATEMRQANDPTTTH